MEHGSRPGSPSTVSLAPSEAVLGPAYKVVSVFLVLLLVCGGHHRATPWWSWWC